MRIYCLEDEDSIRELLIYTLEATGFSPVGFTEPKALYAALEHPPLPDLILLDIMLPGEDGISVLRRLRRRADTGHSGDYAHSKVGRGGQGARP